MQWIQVLLWAVSQQTGSPEKVSGVIRWLASVKGFDVKQLCSSIRMRVKKLPMILALHLKRFKYMDQLHRYTKLSYRVVFPLELRLFNTSGDATNPDRMYDLVAVVVHCGRWAVVPAQWRHVMPEPMLYYFVSSWQWSQPWPLHHHRQKPWILAPLWWRHSRGKAVYSHDIMQQLHLRLLGSCPPTSCCWSTVCTINCFHSCNKNSQLITSPVFLCIINF